MEDLLENFSKHINKIISSKLGSKIRNLARATTNYRTDEDYSRVESNIQMLIESYLSNLKDNDYKEIACNIFNSFVEEDDKNIIKAIKFFIRTYEHYQELNLRKKFFKWRKTSLKLKIINSLVNKEIKAQKDKNILNNDINQNVINGKRYDDNEDNDNIDNNNMLNFSDNNNEDNNNNHIYMNYDNFEKEKNGYVNRDMLRNKNIEKIEEFIKKESDNSEKYHFNYGNIDNNINNNINNNNINNINIDNNDDYKEEFSEELDVNKLYSKKKYN